MVSVKCLGKTQVYDVELAIDIPVRELCATLAAGLGWDTDDQGRVATYSVETHPPGRLLRPDETLAQAQVWDGTWLVLHPHHATVPPTAPETPRQNDPLPGAGFVWKQVA